MGGGTTSSKKGADNKVKGLFAINVFKKKPEVPKPE
jgi:hypothetical protein